MRRSANLERWLDAVALQRVRPRTLERYQGVVSNHLAPQLGHLPLAKLTPQHIERLAICSSTIVLFAKSL